MAILFLFAIFLDTGSFLFLDGHRRSLHQDVGSVSSRVQNTFWEVFTGVFKLCVWVLHKRPLNFTFQLLQFDQKNCAITPSFPPFCVARQFNKTASAMTNHSLMSLWGTHTDFFSFFFFMCIKLLDGDEEPFTALKWWIRWTHSCLIVNLLLL